MWEGKANIFEFVPKVKEIVHTAMEDMLNLLLGCNATSLHRKLEEYRHQGKGW